MKKPILAVALALTLACASFPGFLLGKGVMTVKAAEAGVATGSTEAGAATESSGTEAATESPETGATTGSTEDAEIQLVAPAN